MIAVFPEKEKSLPLVFLGMPFNVYSHIHSFTAQMCVNIKYMPFKYMSG